MIGIVVGVSVGMIVGVVGGAGIITSESTLLVPDCKYSGSDTLTFSKSAVGCELVGLMVGWVMGCSVGRLVGRLVGNLLGTFVASVEADPNSSKLSTNCIFCS